MSQDWTGFRLEFPATERHAYLDTAALAPPSRPVLAALERAQAEWAQCRADWRSWEEAGERARRGFAGLVGTGERGVALLPNAAAGVAQIAERLEPGPRDNLVVGAGEFRSNLFGWLNQERRGFEVRLARESNGRTSLDDFARLVDRRTACVAVSSVQSSSGFEVDLAGLKQLCRERGARLFVDATQSLGVLRHDLDGVDYLVSAGYKWLLGPRGTAYLYVAPEHLGALAPLAPGWKAAARPYDDYYGPPLELPDHARKLDHSLAWLPWVGAAAGVELLRGLDAAAVEARVRGLADAFARELSESGLEPLLPGGERAHVVSLVVREAEHARLALEAAGVVASVRGRWLRLGFHAFNDESDVARACAALTAVVRS